MNDCRRVSSGYSGLDEADIELIERLGAIANIIDPVPEDVRERGRALFAFRDPDADLMDIVELEDHRVEAVRGDAPTSRMHFFEFGEISLDVELKGVRGILRCGWCSRRLGRFRRDVGHGGDAERVVIHYGDRSGRPIHGPLCVQRDSPHLA
jgi:hypothetical protein